jgi:carboxyl-terminal processing protease
LILDLRDSSGGSPEVAGRIASWFAPNKALTMLLLSHNRKQTVKIPAFQAPEGTQAKPWTGKTVILVDRGTSGIAEVLASALDDAKVGQTVGETTFGQGIQQTVYKLKDGSAVSITTGKYLSPLGKDINLKGLAPDVKVTAKAAGDTDPILARAVELAKAQ